jgi:hypothetical protein
MQFYLSQSYCYRGVLSRFLDAKSDWRWCMVGEEPCQVCGQGHADTDARPVGLEFSRSGPAREEAFTGPAEVLRQDYLQDQSLEQYEQEFKLMVGSCLYCRAMDRKFSHTPESCSHSTTGSMLRTKHTRRRRRQGRHGLHSTLHAGTVISRSTSVELLIPSMKRQSASFQTW